MLLRLIKFLKTIENYSLRILYRPSYNNSLLDYLSKPLATFTFPIAEVEVDNDKAPSSLVPIEL